MKPRSPLEMMIDAATGYDGEAVAEKNMQVMKDPVLLYCACGAKKVVEREPDFFDYACIETQCPNCRPSTQAPSPDSGEKT